MIHYTRGNIFDSDAQALVNPVNCVGVAGAGLALQFRERYPQNHQAYLKACQQKKLTPGHILTTRTGSTTNPQFILNLPTKRHWSDNSRHKDVDAGLAKLAAVIGKYSITSIAVPALGAGLGHLQWEQVRDLMEQHLSPLRDVQVHVYEPLPGPRASRP